ncbi:Uncharacterised protein [Mycobacteroides abscessus subsp. abscessus]|nr:Uncharacterised protein [Mycobacteroides abscessus subsp. abscessus]
MTVVSHPGALSTRFGAADCARIQADCTASSASWREPRMRWATDSSRGRSASNFSMRSTRGHLSFLSIVKGVR